jgi:hypothetical protein
LETASVLLYSKSCEYYEYETVTFVRSYKSIWTVLDLYDYKNETKLSFLSKNRKYFPKCLICGTAFDKFGMILQENKKKINSRFCSLECYKLSLTNEWVGLCHPNMIWTHQKRELASIRMKDSIKSGKFTPDITNSWANSRVVIEDNFKFRSSWEAVFWIFNRTCLYESVRIPYFSSIDNKHRIYIVDFEDKVNKILYEIKPDSNTDSTTVKEKTMAAKLWCDSNEYIFKIVSESYFLNLFKSLHNRDIIKEINCSVDLTQRMRQFL